MQELVSFATLFNLQQAIEKTGARNEDLTEYNEMVIIWKLNSNLRKLLISKTWWTFCLALN